MQEDIQEKRAKCLMPLTLKEIRHLRKDELMIVILTREIAFNELRKEWQTQVTSDIKDEFVLRKIDLVIGEDEKLRDVMFLNRRIMLLEQRLIRLQDRNHEMDEVIEQQKRKLELQSRELNKKDKIIIQLRRQGDE